MPPKKARSSARNVTRAPPPKPVVSFALKNTIDTIPECYLRAHIKHYCESMTDLREALERQFMVQGKDIVRYHADTKSEDAEDDGFSSSETEDDSDDESTSNSRKKQLKPIATKDDEFAPRMAKCDHCKEEFDVTTNEKGDCTWHPGCKEVDFEEDFWADHDPECHGDYSDFEDDADMAEGFKWTCCGKVGDDEGCKSTKHKAEVNLIAVTAPKGGQKRKADEVFETAEMDRR